jgi:chromate transporter
MRELAAIFFRVGNLTFGSGDATTALLREELVEQRGWLGDHQFALCYAIARVTPGTNLYALCTGLAWYIRGWGGAVAVLVAMSFPSSVITVLLTIGYQAVEHTELGRAAASGAMAAVVAAILAGAWLLVKPYLRRGNATRTLTLLIAAASLNVLAGLPPLPIVFLAGAVGALWKQKAVS